MTEGDVILTPLPQADGRVKNRPCIALRQMPSFGDWLVCGVSTQLRQAVSGLMSPFAAATPTLVAVASRPRRSSVWVSLLWCRRIRSSVSSAPWPQSAILIFCDG
jgi:hypothetical protein